MKQFLMILFFLGTHSFTSPLNASTEADLTLCEDQAENYGNGKGDDFITTKCQESTKKMARPSAIKESKILNSKFYGYKNRIVIEKKTEKTQLTLIIAGSSTELQSVISLSLDEKNQELAALEESGDILFFSTKLAGNIAPLRIIKNKQLVGSSEIIIDSKKDLVLAFNKKEKKILFFSRKANFHGRPGKQKLNIVKTINTSLYELSNLAIDSEHSRLQAFDLSQDTTISFDLK